MGNNSTSSSGATLSGNTSNVNASSNTSMSSFGGLFGGTSWFSFFSSASMNQATRQCYILDSTLVWMGIKIFILLTGLPANVGLMWLLLRSRRALSASEVLGLNLAVLDLLYCLCLPLGVYEDLNHALSKQAISVAEALSALNIFGCPLLLACMCVERYLAAVRPVTYMRLGKWEYRAALCALAWLLTLVVVLLVYFLGVFSMVLYLALITSVLFLLMLFCLVGIVRVLCRSGPGEGAGAGSGGGLALKRRAVKNVLAVFVPSVVAYTPMVALVPFLSAISSEKEDKLNAVNCRILQLLLTFPNVGLYIGPLFYLSRVRQLPCCKGRKGDKEQRQTELSNSKTTEAD